MSVGLKYSKATMMWIGIVLAAVGGCYSEGGVPTVRDGSMNDALQGIEIFDDDGPQNDLVDSLAEWNDQGTDEEQRNAGFEDLPRMDRVDILTPTDVWLDRLDEMQSEFDGSRGDAGVFMMGAVRQVAAADQLTCVVPMSGDVYCWGDHLTFQLELPREVRYRPRQMAGYRSIVNMAHYSSICAIDEGGDVWCSGYDAGGLAVGSDGGRVLVAAMRMDVRNAVRLAWQLSGSVLLVVRADGMLYARVHVPPVQNYTFSFPSPAIDVSANADSYCVVLRDGRVACMGSYISDVTPWPFSEGPRIVEGLTDVSSIAVGWGFYCALKRDGTVWCWGGNNYGQTGTPPPMAERCYVYQYGSTTITRVYGSCVRRPRQVEGLTDVVEVSAGEFMVCARKRDGTVWCWGDNSAVPRGGGPGGTIGDGLPATELCRQEPWDPPGATPDDPPCRTRPSRVVGLTGVTGISLGGNYSCAALASGQVWCWGRNATGLLGDGTDVYRATPVPVLPPL